jgi:uncharacterized iron-regulated membrane protein
MIRRLIGQIHLWAGLALCIPFAMLGLTGSILVFEDELNRAFGPAAKHVAAGGAARPTSDIIAAARAVAPAGFVPIAYTARTDIGELASVRLTPPGRSGPGTEMVRIRVDPVSLETFPESQSTMLRQIFYLHSTLLMKNREGRQLVGWLGVVMLVMGVSGLVNWWPGRNHWRSAFSVSKQARGFRLHRELHGAAGIWGLLVFIVVSFAGVYLAFPATIRSGVDLVLPARDLRAKAAAVRAEPIAGAEPLGVDGAIELARASAPGTEPVSAFLPTRPDQPFRIGLLRPDQESGAPAVTVFIDPWARRVIEVLDPRKFSIGERILAWQHALHAGEALGGAWKILVFLSGLLPPLFVFTGISMWWIKRGRRKSPVATQDLVFDQIDTARRAGE